MRRPLRGESGYRRFCSLKATRLNRVRAGGADLTAAETTLK
jgi:hypothetical protein